MRKNENDTYNNSDYEEITERPKRVRKTIILAGKPPGDYYEVRSSKAIIFKQLRKRKNSFLRISEEI